jgi:hypothetical protein
LTDSHLFRMSRPTQTSALSARTQGTGGHIVIAHSPFATDQ